MTFTSLGEILSSAKTPSSPKAKTRPSQYPSELIESLTYPGFLRLAAKFWKTGLGEMWRSASKRAFVKALSRLVPEIKTFRLAISIFP